MGNGVIILLISNLIVKIIGVMFKIPLVNIIGDEGMGYFNSAYTIYTLFFTLSTSGLPVAVSILISRCIAEHRSVEKKRIFKITSSAFLVIGIIGSMIMLLGSKLLAGVIGSINSYLCIASMSFVLLFVCVSGAIRGYFQGHQNMLPTGISQIIESFGKLVFGIFFAMYAVYKSYPSYIVAAFGVFGITVSSAVSMIYLMIYKLLFDKKETIYNNSNQKDIKNILRQLFKTAIPITVSSSVMSLTNVIDLSIVMRRLSDIGYSSTEATSIYGNYSGIAVPMFNMPSAIVTPIAMSVIPYIAAEIINKNYLLAKKTVESALKITAMLTFPCAFGLSLLSRPILRLFFNPSQGDKAANLLSILAIAIVFVGYTTVSTALLQAYGKNKLPIFSMLLGAVSKLLSGYILIGNFGMVGTPLSTIICYSVTTAVNLYFVKKYSSADLKIVNMIIKPLLFSCISVIIGLMVYYFGVDFIGEKLACVGSIIISGMLYLCSIIVFKLLTKDDTKLFPGGRIIEKFLFN